MFNSKGRLMTLEYNVVHNVQCTMWCILPSMVGEEKSRAAFEGGSGFQIFVWPMLLLLLDAARSSIETEHRLLLSEH